MEKTSIMDKNQNLSEIAKVFFKLGCFAFGGPAAHIAMMEKEIVEKRKWMTHEYFLDLMGATNLIPGPNSTEMTMHCGYERGGWKGLFIAGACFIFPAVMITGFLAYLYVKYGQLPEVENFIYGIKPAVLAIIAGAIYKLGKKALKGFELAILGILVIAASLLGVNEVIALLVAGILGAIYFYIKNGGKVGKGNLNSLLPFTLLQIPTAGLMQVGTLKVFLTFLKVGAVLYGSGYVLFAYLDAELVTKGLLTRMELLDAIAVGQFTPGPVLSTSTFIGYQLNGVMGAIAATVGIFLPSFIFVLLLNPLVHKLRSSKFLGYFLDSVNIAAVAVMVAVLWKMGVDTLVDWRTVLIAVLSVAVNFGFKNVSSMWIVLGGAVLGWILSFL